MSYRVGVDIGGTFADFCAFDQESGSLQSVKVLTTPDRPGQEVIDGLEALHERLGIAASEIDYFTHGTTVGVNALIMRRGIRLALFTTENFCDVLELARLKMPDPYHLLSTRPEPLVPRDLVFGVQERLRADETVDVPLDRGSLLLAAKAAQEKGATGVVLSFLHSYRNPEHEARAAEILSDVYPGLHVFCSHRVRPMIREYERTSTAVIHGYLQPRVAAYLEALQGSLAGIGVTPEPMITKSNGGVMSAESGKSACVDMLLSGTAAGVMGAAYVAREAEAPRVLSLDIGGTSADVAIIRDGRPSYGSAEVIGEFPIHVPSVSVTSIGEGGGSIARIDPAGMLRVGPDSAGSVPGPAGYNRGGTEATITDAFIAMGLLGHSALGYGMVAVDAEKSRAAIAPLAQALGRNTEETAEGIIGVAISGMYREVSKLCSRRGVDVRDFSLLAFGGGGPMMACFLARELGMTEVIVPPTPGVLSALGGLTADLRNDFTAVAYNDLSEETAQTLSEKVKSLRARAEQWLFEEQGYEGEAVYQVQAEMRYRGQSFEIDVDLDTEALSRGDVAPIAAAFNLEHRRLYGHADPEAPIQVIAVSVIVTGHAPKPTLPRYDVVERDVPPDASTEAFLDGDWREVSLFARASLSAGARFSGPCIVQQDDTTVIVPPGFAGKVDACGNLILSHGGTNAD